MRYCVCERWGACASGVVRSFTFGAFSPTLPPELGLPVAASSTFIATGSSAAGKQSNSVPGVR